MHPDFLRLGVFLAVFTAVAIAEAVFPRRPRRLGRLTRWPGNLGVNLLSSLAVHFVLPLSSVAAAAYAANHDFGLFNWLGLPPGAAFVVGLIALDGMVWFQHVIFHRVPWLWRLHRVHHADVDLDGTSGVRFHPIEIVLSALLKLGVIVMFGASVACVVAFEIILNATAMFNHGNIYIPVPIDRVLRWFVVTPDMHRVHHSVVQREMNRNFGFNLPWWDRLFRTYQAAPATGHAAMEIGLPGVEADSARRLGWILRAPFRGKL